MQPEGASQTGIRDAGKFVHVRMAQNLCEPAALEAAITYSGGVFREMARIMRTAIGRARRRKGTKLDVSDVEWAAAEIRNEYRRILDRDDLKLLKKVAENNRMEYKRTPTAAAATLALLEYRDGENWCDVHPVLRKLLDD